MSDRDWLEWHSPYDVPGSALSRRLASVQQRISQALDLAPAGSIRVISMCAGQGRDLLGVLAEHPRRHDVVGRLVELDARNVAFARELAAAHGIASLEIVEDDASTTAAYEGATPADLVLACGIFGNVSDDDIHRTVDHLPGLLAPGGTVIWTRHRRPPDLTPTLRRWFGDAGFDEIAFDEPADALFGVGTHRLTAEPRHLDGPVRLFTFVGDGTLGWR